MTGGKPSSARQVTARFGTINRRPSAYFVILLRMLGLLDPTKHADWEGERRAKKCFSRSDLPALLPLGVRLSPGTVGQFACYQCCAASSLLCRFDGRSVWYSLCYYRVGDRAGCTLIRTS